MNWVGGGSCHSLYLPHMDVPSDQFVLLQLYAIAVNCISFSLHFMFTFFIPVKPPTFYGVNVFCFEFLAFKKEGQKPLYLL